MSDALTRRLERASVVARRAGALALDYFRRRDALAVETKASRLDPVSLADRAVEAMIRQELSAAFPEDAFLGEEGGGGISPSGLTWVLDPIDGTVPFLAGLPHWCVVIALAEGPETHLGVIDVPVTGEHFTARAGQGAALDGAALRLDPARRLQDQMIGVGASDRTDPGPVTAIIGGIMRAGGIYYRNGSGANMLACVAAGRLGGYAEPDMNPWDSIAGLLMIREAGGVTHPYPADQKLGLTMGAAPGIWEELSGIAYGAMGRG